MDAVGGKKSKDTFAGTHPRINRGSNMKRLELQCFVKIHWNGEEQIGQIDGRSLEGSPHYDIELPKGERAMNFPAQAIISYHKFKELM